jgi:hypothetical protein
VKTKQIGRSIYTAIKNSTNPISTREISIKIKRAWHTVDRHCLKLELQGKIRGFKIGNINAWILNKK